MTLEIVKYKETIILDAKPVEEPQFEDSYLNYLKCCLEELEQEQICARLMAIQNNIFDDLRRREQERNFNDRFRSNSWPVG